MGTRRSATSAWRYRSYRRLWSAQLVSHIGTNSQKTALAWLAFTATDPLLGAALAVGIVGGSRFVPMVVVGTRAGRWVDRHPEPHRLLARVETFVAIVTGLGCLALIAGIGSGVGLLISVSLVGGLALVVEPPALAVLSQDAVPAGARGNALASLGVLSDVSKVSVPALAGTAIVLDATALLLLFNTVSCLVLACVLARYRPHPGAERGHPILDPAEPTPASRPRIVAPDRVRTALLIAAIGSLPALELATWLPLVAGDIGDSDGDNTRFGVISFATGIASLGAGLACARWLHRGSTTLTLFLLACYTTSLLGLGAAVLANTFPAAVASCAFSAGLLAGVLSVSYVTFLGTAEPGDRGRVASLWALAITGGTVISAPAVGTLATLGGVAHGLLAAITLSGVSLAAATMIAKRARGPHAPKPAAQNQQ